MHAIHQHTFGGPGGRPTLPMVPGREVAGVVDAIGADVDDRWCGRTVAAHLGATGGGYAEVAVAHGTIEARETVSKVVLRT